MKIARIIISIFISLVALNASASKAFSLPTQIKLKDGRTVTVRLRGDEHISFYVSTDNEIILADNEGYYIATAEERDSINNVCIALQRENEISWAKGVRAPYSTNSATEGGSETIIWNNACPSKGDVVIPVILIEFADGVKLTKSREEIEEYFNREEVAGNPYGDGTPYYNYCSISGFFKFCSNNQFRPRFEIFGPYTSSYKSTDFGSNSSRNMPFFKEALSLADKDIDFSKYDIDKNNYTDNIFVLYAGYGSHYAEEGSKLIWPHSNNFTYSTTYDGMRIGRYCISNELALTPEYVKLRFNNQPRMSIGVACHEFSHTLGLPDLYPTITSWAHADYDNQSMEEWSLMDGGGGNKNSFAPTPLNAWERAILGWSEPIKALKEADDITLKPLEDGGVAYKIPNSYNSDEYIVLETMPKNSKWYRGLSNSGLMVTHIKWERTPFSSNTVNNTKGSPRINIIPADGYLTSSYNAIDKNKDPYGYEGDLYPGAAKKTSITNWLNRYSWITDKPVTDITQNADYSVSFKFMGGLLMGDANDDGMVNFADINAITDYYLGKDVKINLRKADINQDGKVDIIDANMLIK